MFRIVKSGGKAAVADWALAAKALQLFNVEINPRPLEENGLADLCQTSAYEEFLRDSFIKHENDKSEDEEKKYVKRESSSKVALAQSLSVHRPDLVLIAEDGRKILGHRSLLSLPAARLSSKLKRTRAKVQEVTKVKYGLIIITVNKHQGI